ncbi:putative sorbitol dehydrogenase protein [Neofusicoccum parvum UCRNP2]|uniref:Alcohol dehydrogenase superfamily zinc-containing n=2 Tax=Neofusicoccum parvum TaxID=310453 RepID=A0ACB5SQP7_9PEZI|nr:putative sorbitol dehydrogenase protein [Neofusicoccum parvum UCRNP2]GME52982.1 Alcohol dehydrogenase superfamily zinc-containing [Neofusicoccum parvum]
MLEAIKNLTTRMGSNPNKTMRAVRFHGQRDLRLEDIPEPQVGKGQVKLKPAWVGICGSDLHEYMGGASICPTTPHPITGETVPLTFGHEFSGVIEEVGEGVTDFKVGDRVCVQPIIYDGDCGACTEGLINCCYKNGFIGLSGWGGGLAEHIVTPQSCLYKLPENVSLEIGALIEPLAVGWHAVNISPWKPESSVLVLGGGPIGLSVIQALRARGATKIIVSEVSPRRKEFAKQFGAHYVLDPTKDDVPARCRELCEKQGVHVVFDCAGVQAGLDAAVQAVRARGTIVNIAIWEKRCSIFPNDFCFKERSYIGVATYQAGDFQDVLNAISEGRLKPDEMITKRIELDQVEAEGFKTLIDDKDNQVKVLVRANRFDIT